MQQLNLTGKERYTVPFCITFTPGDPYSLSKRTHRRVHCCLGAALGAPFQQKSPKV